MLHLGSTYIITEKFEKCIEFYTKLLDMQPSGMNKNRWCEFNFDNKCIAINNLKFDAEYIKECDAISKHYNDNYLDWWLKDYRYNKGNNFVLNFWAENLNNEIDRLKALGLVVSKVKYVNIAMPYWFVTVYDPDGNMIEITGDYKADETKQNYRRT